MLVSIHAPARGATIFAKFFDTVILVSIHAPARGATLICICGIAEVHVSIHAPARGATYTTLKNIIMNTVSIHAPARGATKSIIQRQSPTVFQSTHPHGVRQGIWSCYIPVKCFNPRTRTGCDTIHPGASAIDMMFQSTHPHGVRLSSIISVSALSTFQSTHPHGVRLLSRGLFQKHCRFQSTHPHGVRHKGYSVVGLIRGFNPRTRTGCDCINITNSLYGHYKDKSANQSIKVLFIDRIISFFK